MKTQLIFGCLFAALTAPALYADDEESKEPKDEFVNLILSDDETNKEGYLFAFADQKGISFQLINDEIASADEDETAETSSEEETPRTEEV